jgi:prophage regulatory protein
MERQRRSGPRRGRALGSEVIIILSNSTNGGIFNYDLNLSLGGIMNEGIVFGIGDRFLKIGDCLKIIPVAQSTWWAGVKVGRFPKPIKIGGNSFWRYSDVMKVVQGDSASQ